MSVRVSVCVSCLVAPGPVSSVWAVQVSRGMEGLFALEVNEALVTVGGGAGGEQCV